MINLCILLSTALTVLKLGGVLQISWWLVLLPIGVPLSLVLLNIILLAIIVALTNRSK